jgi:hypothetical protein
MMISNLEKIVILIHKLLMTMVIMMMMMMMMTLTVLQLHNTNQGTHV